MSGRPWTTSERRTAARMRLEGRTNAEIGRAIDRSAQCVSKFLVRHRLNRTATDRRRDDMLRRAYPLRLDGATLEEVAAAVGWPSSVEALRQALAVYRRRIGREAA